MTERSAVDSLFEDLASPGSPGMAVGIYHRGKSVHAAGYGYADIEHGVPVTAQTVFHVASVSKHFAAFAIALLAREGKVELDSDIRTYLDFVPDFGTPITVRHLIHHTSGLRDQWALFELGGQGIDNRLRQQQILNMVARQRELNFEPGTESSYCNTGYTLLAEIVRAVTKSALRQFTTERVFRPLGMARTFFYDDVTEVVPGRAHSYERKKNVWRRALLNYDTVGATSLLTTAEDMTKWGGNFARHIVGDSDLIEQICANGALRDGSPVNYGFGLEHGRYASHDAVLHFGGDAGFRAVFAYFPDEEFSISVLANHPPEDWDRLITGIVDLYLNGGSGWLENYSPRVVTPDPALIQRLVGCYASDFEPIVELKSEDGQLLWASGLAEPRVVSFRTDGTFDLGNTMRAASHYRVVQETAGEVLAIREVANKVHARTKLLRRLEPYEPESPDLASLAGSYRSSELDVTYSLIVQDGCLAAHSLWLPKPITLAPAGRDRFGWGAYLMEVVRDAGERPVALRIHGSRIRHVLFERVSCGPP